MEDESSGLRGTRNFSPNKNYEGQTKTRIFVGVVVLILLILLGIGIYFLLQESNVSNLEIIPKGRDHDGFIDFNRSDYKQLTESIDRALEVYEIQHFTPAQIRNIYTCDYNNPPPKGKVCDVDIKSWSPCTKDNFYNYNRLAPCIFLKLNNIVGWVPEFYNKSNELPSNMPEDLKAYIANVEKTTPKKLNAVWVSCEGESPVDIENIGPIQYIPERAFPGFYYPIENIDGYRSPLVAILLERPIVGIVINIKCKAWARNLMHDQNDQIGSAHFELVID